MARSLYDFADLGYLELSEFGFIHADKLEAEATLYPYPKWTPDEIRTASQKVFDDHTAWEANHGDTEHSNLLVSNGELISKLKANADYVTYASGGDALKIQKAAFTPSAGERAPVQRDHYTVTVGDTKGKVVLYFRKEGDTIAVVWLACKKDTEPTADEYRFLTAGSLDRLEFDGLESGKKYYFMAAPVKRGGDVHLQFETPIDKIIP